MTPWTPAFETATPHGVLAGVHLPPAPDPVPAEILAELPPAERACAEAMRGYRQVEFVGGRLALRAAMRAAGAPLQPVLPDERGTPRLAPGWTGSVSHKRTLAVGMVARTVDGTLGVDLEDREPPRSHLADRLLRPAELAAIADLPEDRRWTAILLRFSIKEAIYKAVDPWVRRWVGFHEAEVHLGLDGTAAVTLHLERGEGPFVVDARYQWMPGRVLASVRLRRGSAEPTGGSHGGT